MYLEKTIAFHAVIASYDMDLHSLPWCKIQEYNKRYPNIYVEIKMGQVSELMELIKQNQLDMVIFPAITPSALDYNYRSLAFYYLPNYTIEEQQKT
jgi:hypothetical protein